RRGKGVKPLRVGERLSVLPWSVVAYASELLSSPRSSTVTFVTSWVPRGTGYGVIESFEELQSGGRPRENLASWVNANSPNHIVDCKIARSLVKILFHSPWRRRWWLRYSGTTLHVKARLGGSTRNEG